MPTPALDPLFIAYNRGDDGRILRTICIVRKYFTQETASIQFWQFFLSELGLRGTARPPA